MREREGYWSGSRRRRVNRRRFLLGSGVAAAGSAAILAGCGGGESPAPATPSVAPTATRPPTPVPTPTPSPTPDPNAPRRGGTLRLWKTAEDHGLDPAVFHVNNTEVIHATMTQACTYQPTKNLFAMDGMTGYEQVEPTTLVWSVRPGMEFHNGDPVDAEAVAFSWRRLDDLYGATGGAAHTRRDGFDFVDAFEAADGLTVTERWSRPNADALVHRARHYYSFINPRMVERFGAVEGSIERADGAMEDALSLQDLPFGSGSGPYTLARRDATGTRLERWPDYHRHVPADDGFVEDGPHIDAWETRILDRVDARAAFLAGELDAYEIIEPDDLREFEGLDHVAVTEVPNGGFSFLGMDGGKFHDKRARLALQKAFDYEGFIEAMRPLGGSYAAPISDLLPHFQRLGQQELQEWYRHDPAEARALWEAADFAVPIDKITVRLIAIHPFLIEIGEFAARSLDRALGIEAEAVAIDSHIYIPNNYVLDRSEDVKEWDILGYGAGEAGGTSGIPHDSNLVHYDPRDYGNSAFNHYVGSPRPEIDADARTLAGMLEAQERILDPDARADLLTDIQRWILDRHWCNQALPVSAVSHYGFSARLRDHAPDDWLNFYDRRRESMWLADAQAGGGST